MRLVFLAGGTAHGRTLGQYSFSRLRLLGSRAPGPTYRELASSGASLLTGILILTLMILPTIMLVAHASIAQVPVAYIQSFAALGFSR